MSKTNYLFQRDGRYYFRARLPAELVQALGKKELKRSLGTKCLTVAIKRSRPLAALISQLRTMSDIENILRQLREAGLSPDKLTHKIGKVTVGNVHFDNLEIDPSKPGDVEAAIKVIDSTIKSQAASYPPAPVPSSSPLSSIMLSKAIDDYIEYYETTEQDEMLGKIKSTIKIIFLELIGDKPIDEIKKRDLQEFFKEAQKLPPTWTSKFNKGQSIALIIQNNHGLPGLSENTVKTTYRAALKGFLDYTHSKYEDMGFPKFQLTKHDITYKGDKKIGDGSQREFKLEELKHLFLSKKLIDYANDPAHVHEYWLPLIALHTGARVREICQINPLEDIDTLSGVECLIITEETKDKNKADPEVIKKLKRAGSERNIPIHPKLIELGFLDYVSCLVDADIKRLFPFYPVTQGDAGAVAADDFSDLLKELELRDDTPAKKLTGLHAFRHTFITYAENNDISKYWVITGHDDKNIPESAKSYRGAKHAPMLLEIIKKFSFNIDFARPVSLDPAELKLRVAQVKSTSRSKAKK